MNEVTLGRTSVAVRREYATVPLVQVERHKVLQILINLISNAKSAMEEAGQAERHLILRVKSGREHFVSLEVEDNGIGIPPENLPRLFQHGFTTKSDGHGFGLHSSITNARELGGHLTARSAGRGAANAIR